MAGINGLGGYSLSSSSGNLRKPVESKERLVKTDFLNNNEGDTLSLVNRKDTNEAEAKKSSSGSFHDLPDEDKRILSIYFSLKNPDQTGGYTDSNGVTHIFKNGEEIKTFKR